MVDFDSAIPRFESWHPSQPVRSPRCCFLMCENRRHFRGLSSRPPPTTCPTEGVDRHLGEIRDDALRKISPACQEAWQKLLDETGRIASIATRDWAIIGQTV
jgi:hypothetical protein